MMRAIGIREGLYFNNNRFDYTLVVFPDAESDEKIRTEKTEFAEQYPFQSLKKQNPYIILAGFTAKEEMEDTLVRWIQNICNLQGSFSITLNNFSGFPPNTIYLRIQDHSCFKPITNALKILDGFIRSNECPPLHIIEKPHLIIAQGLPQYVYEPAIKEYAGKSFHAHFNVNKLVLLKTDTYGTEQVINTFRLPAAI